MSTQPTLPSSQPPNSAWYPSEQELATPSGMRRSVQAVLERVYALQKTSGQQIQAHNDLTQTVIQGLAPEALAAALSSSGGKPLDITGLVGKVGESQLASVPNYSALPAPYDPVTQNGALISINGQLYQYNQPLTSWVALAAEGVKLEDTHANRLANYPASNYPIAILFYETDRNVFYENDGTFGASNWIYKLGTMRGTLNTDQRPVDLGTHDTGFLFFGTDWTITYRWSGTAWIYYSGIYADIAANRPTSLGSNDKNFLFISTDTKLFEYWDGAAWILIGAVPTNLVLAVRDVAGSTATLTAADFAVISTNSGAAAFALPDATTVPGQVFAISNSSGSTNTLTVNAFAGQTIAGNSAFAFLPGESFIIGSDGSTNWNVYGIVRNSSAGAWANYTPSVTPSAGTATVSSSVCAFQHDSIDKIVYIRIYIKFTVSTTAQNVELSLPVNPVSLVPTYAQTLALTLTAGGFIQVGGAVIISALNVIGVFGVGPATFLSGTTYEIVIGGDYQPV